MKNKTSKTLCTLALIVLFSTQVQATSKQKPPVGELSDTSWVQELLILVGMD